MTTNLSCLLCVAWLPAWAWSVGAVQLVSTNADLPVQIVTLRNENGIDPEQFAGEYGLKPTLVYRYALRGFAARIPEALAAKLQADERVLAVEADGPVTLYAQTNCAGLVRMGIDTFPIARINGTNDLSGVHVAVVDTGIDTNHEDLKVYTNHSIIFSDGLDWNGHGTAVAGVLAASDNGVGVVGVAPEIRLWNIQCIGPPPFDAWSYAVAGMDYVAQHSKSISIASISFGNSTTAPLTPIRTAVRAMVNAGVVVVAAAGNDARDLSGPDGVFDTNDDAFPASFREAMAVSAMDPLTDTFYRYSNFSAAPRTSANTNVYTTNFVFSPGGAIDVAAPGVGVVSTGTNNTYVTNWGTSFAAPHVAGLVALYIAANGRATNAEGVYRIRQAIVNASLPQSNWRTNQTGDPDSNPEPLAIANESWVPKPVISSYTRHAGSFQLNFDAVPGYDYTAQYSTGPSGSNWVGIATVSGKGYVTNAFIEASAPAGNQGFYRLLRKPSP